MSSELITVIVAAGGGLIVAAIAFALGKARAIVSATPGTWDDELLDKVLDAVVRARQDELDAKAKPATSPTASAD